MECFKISKCFKISINNKYTVFYNIIDNNYFGFRLPSYNSFNAELVQWYLSTYILYFYTQYILL